MSCFSNIPGAGIDFFVDEHPYFIQAFVKVGSVTGELVTLVAEINLFFLVTGAYPAVFKQVTLLVPTSLAVFRSQAIQHFF